MIKVLIWIVLAAVILWVVASLAPFVRKSVDKIVHAFKGALPVKAQGGAALCLNLSDEAQDTLQLLTKANEVVADMKSVGINDTGLSTTIAGLSKKFDTLIQPELDRIKGVQIDDKSA